MSSEAEGAETEHVCANCGIAEVDEIKLEECGCAGCNLVNKCSEEHREQHDEGARKGTTNYSDNPMAAMKGNARSASCRCRLIKKNLRFIHAAVLIFVMAVDMLITQEMGTIVAHFVESRR